MIWLLKTTQTVIEVKRGEQNLTTEQCGTVEVGDILILSGSLGALQQTEKNLS